MKRFSIFLILALILLSFCTPSCTEKTNELESQHFKLIDSLVLQQKKIRGAELDSLCDLHMDQRVSVAVDSIMKRRLIEIEKIMNSANTIEK